jgi:2,4-dienoyl-CoA reductase-like NADH-dependent reductase (Old Yellow Enzyme family)/pyruvate/2-oxoglutarate dehydrogenase complex dihydrolipoamide dehydrogenase (E3) component
MYFENLFSPIRIGTRTTRNRIIFPCHSYEALPFPEYIAYEAARAKGGCGLNIIGPCVVHNSGVTGGEHTHEIDTPEILLSRWKAMAAAVHEYGTLVLIQLWHVGDKSEGLAKTSWGVSENPVNNDLGRAEVPHEMTDAEITEVIEGFVKYAIAAREAGLDGCEIHGSHGYLPQQFWSPWVNHRTDKWKEPLLFIKEVVGKIRAAAGKDFIIGVRMSGDDLYPEPGGLDIEKSKQLARDLEATGNVDFLNISVGHGGNSNAFTIASMYIPPASISVPLASGIKQAVRSIPVIACGRINDPAIAEKAITDGHCDLVGLVRGQIADPEFSNKAREGRIEDIRLCIACNQGCSVEGRPRCTQNLVSGRETKDIAVIKPAAQKKKVMVIGGGPAGMETARVSALRGHDVTLYEKGAQLGGLINTLIKAPGREEFSQVTRYLTHQISRSGITVNLNVTVTAEMVEKEKPDTVIVAVGARPYIEPVPGSDLVQLVSPSQVLDAKVDAGRKAVIYDCTGEQEAPNVADYLGEKGVQVELVTSQVSLLVGLMTPAGIIATRNPLIWQRLRRNGVNITNHAKIKGISDHSIRLVDVWSGEESIIDDVDTVVMATGYLPNNDLFKSLQGRVKELYAIGDCVIPKRALNAIHDAYTTALYI